MLVVTNDNFPDIYGKLKNSVYSIAYNYLQNPSDAGDIMQDTFVKLLVTKHEFEDTEHIKAWLLRVCINACKNYLRDNKNHGDLELIESLPAKGEEVDTSILEAVLKLPEKYRIPIHLFYYEDYSVKEIAEFLSITESATKVRLKRGRDILKKTLGKDFYFDTGDN